MKNKETKKQNKEARRMSLQTRITILYLISFLVAGILAGIISNSYRRKKAMEQCSQRTLCGCELVNDLLQQHIFKETYLLGSIRIDNLKEVMSSVCNALGLETLYIYSVNEDGDRYYLYLRSGDKNKQVIMDEMIEKGYDTYNQSELTDAEITALRGEIDTNPTVTKKPYGTVCTCVYPFVYYNQVVALISAECSIDVFEKAMQQDNLFLLAIGGLLFLFMFILIQITVRFSVVRPIRALSSNMDHFQKDHNLVFPQRKHRVRDEVSDMENSFHLMADEIGRYIEDVRQLTEEKVKADVQMQVAKRIQNGMVPPYKEFRTHSSVVAATISPALEVGGDFYDVFERPDKRLVFMIGDISGKGISAALFMEMIRRILRERLMEENSPAEALKISNFEILKENPEGFFATVFVCIWNPETDTLTFSNAGHNAPIRLGDQPSFMDVESGTMLGLFDDPVYEDESIQMQEGEGILLYTDGVTEALDEQFVDFGNDRLLATLKETGLEPEEIVKDVSRRVRSFEGKREAFDDVTLIAFRKEVQKEVNLLPQLSELSKIQDELKYHIPDREQWINAMYICEEWFVNVVSYSKANNIWFSVDHTGKGIKVVFTDDGQPFDPFTYDVGAKDFDQLDTGGMGIGILRNMTKNMEYRRENEKNYVTLYID